jgi:hypothetical protein
LVRNTQRGGAGDFQHYWWTNEARDEMAGLITQIGLEACSVCGAHTLYIMPWPAIVGIGGLRRKPKARRTREPRCSSQLFAATHAATQCCSTPPS